MDGNNPNIHAKIFDGSDYVPELDNERLGKQMKRVFLAMMDGRWRTLSEVEKITGDPQASISAQLRHMRKPKFGSHTIEKRTRGERQRGLFEYRLILNNSRSI
jgi:hypothetical protein